MAALALAFWLWLGAVMLTGLLALATGAAARPLAEAGMLAIAPALAGFILLPRLGEIWAQRGLCAAWLLAAAGLAAGTGGMASPLAAALLIAPALAWSLGRRETPETGAAAVLAFALAAWAGAHWGGATGLGAFPALLAAASLAFAAGLIVLGRGERQALPAQSGLVMVAADGAIAQISLEAAKRLPKGVGAADIYSAFGGLGEAQRSALAAVLDGAAKGEARALVLEAEGRTFDLNARQAEAGVLLEIHDVTRWAARGEAMSRRVAEISHELRTPLTHILGFSEMIQSEIFGPVGERNKEYAGMIRASGGHLLELVNDLLDLSKIEAGRYQLELEAFDARAIVDEVVRLSADSAARKHIAVLAHTPIAPLNVRADPRALRQILLNTVGNAIKFTPEHGRIDLRARAEAGALVLDTVDSGPGISEAERARLGHAYEQGEAGAHAQGTGLGLALVRALAGLHGGGLSFHDAPEGGALVRVTLPVLTD